MDFILTQKLARVISSTTSLSAQEFLPPSGEGAQRADGGNLKYSLTRG